MVNKKIAQGAIGTGSGTLAYTTPSGYQSIVKDINITNTTSGLLTVTLNLVPFGVSVSASNRLLSTADVPPNTTLQWEGEQVLNTGDFIQIVGSGSGLTMNISGEEKRQ